MPLFRDLKVRQRFVYEGSTFKKLDAKHALKPYGGDVGIVFKPDTEVSLPAKRQSKTERWNTACQQARDALERALDAQTKMDESEEGSDEWTGYEAELNSIKEAIVDALSNLHEMATEFGEVFDNMNDGAQQSPYGQKCEAMQQLDLEATAEDSLDDLEIKIDEAEGTEVPLGFGRD